MKGVNIRFYSFNRKSCFSNTSYAWNTLNDHEKRSDIKNIRDQFVSKLESGLSVDQINEIKTELFGKNGLISSKFKTIGSIPETDRKKFASDLNQAKDELQNLITSNIIKDNKNKRIKKRNSKIEL